MCLPLCSISIKYIMQKICRINAGIGLLIVGSLGADIWEIQHLTPRFNHSKTTEDDGIRSSTFCEDSFNPAAKSSKTTRILPRSDSHWGYHDGDFMV